MPPAFDDSIVHLTLGQRYRFVRALVVNREQLTTGAHQADGDLINDNTEGSVLDKIGWRGRLLRPDAQEGGPKPTLLRSSLQPRSVRRVRFQLEV